MTRRIGDPAVSILGVSVSQLTVEQALTVISHGADRGPCQMLTYVNAHTLNLAVHDRELRNALNRSTLVMNDGIGVSLAARMRKERFPENLNGSDFTVQLLELAATNQWGVFLLGGEPGIAETAGERLSERIEGLHIVGTCHGFTGESDDLLARRVRGVGTAMLIVALGSPAQEIWIDRNLAATGALVGVGVGAFLDFSAGKVVRAPRWMNVVGIEWCFRLIQEPRRLWRRYVVGNPLFLLRAWRDRHESMSPPPSAPYEREKNAPAFAVSSDGMQSEPPEIISFPTSIAKRPSTASRMDSVTLAPGITSTRIGFGCAGLMRDPSARKRQRLLAEAFDQGIRHFDVARMYGLGAAEGELGRFARGRRDLVVIATKFGIEPASASGRLARLQAPARWLLAHYPALRGYAKRRSDAFHQPHRYDAAIARASLQTSLRELQTDYVDLLLVHDPSPADHVDLPGICAYLEEARQAGHVRAWGVAGEQDPCIQLKRSLPATAILQVRDDILSRTRPFAGDLEPLITFGVLGEGLERLAKHLKNSPEHRSQWSEELGVDCSSSQALAALLLRDALDVNPRGVVLYSTTRPEHLHGLDTIASTTTDGNDPALTAFRRRVNDELATS